MKRYGYIIRQMADLSRRDNRLVYIEAASVSDAHDAAEAMAKAAWPGKKVMAILAVLSDGTVAIKGTLPAAA